jgi:hypothetical protein
MRLEKVIADLREELKSKRPVSSHNAGWETDRMEYEVRLQKA